MLADGFELVLPFTGVVGGGMRGIHHETVQGRYLANDVTFELPELLGSLFPLFNEALKHFSLQCLFCFARKI